MIIYMTKKMKLLKKFCKPIKINYINYVVNNGKVGKLKNILITNN